MHNWAKETLSELQIKTTGQTGDAVSKIWPKNNFRPRTQAGNNET